MGRLTIHRFMKACKNSGGIITLIAKKMDVSRQQLYLFLDKNPEMFKYLEEERNQIIDVAESKLFTAIQTGDLDSVKWFLSRVGKRRGYADKDIIINNEANTGPTYKFIVEKPDFKLEVHNDRNKVEAKSQAITSV